MPLVQPHGSDRRLHPLLLSGDELDREKRKAIGQKAVVMTSRETSDIIMLGIGAFTPLTGFMGKDDYLSVCDRMFTDDGTFWPIPITLSTSQEEADQIEIGQEITLIDEETNTTMATMRVDEKYSIDKEYECKSVFRTTDAQHPGVAKVYAQKPVNLGGPVKVVSESYYPVEFADVYLRPDQTRKIFEARGWNTVAALQLRNPMHRSHEYLAKIALETIDGLFIHQLVGKLKAGDIPALVRVKCVDVLVAKYFVENSALQGGYPMEMRYAGPREALLHAIFRQNFGCSHLIVGRDHAGVGDYYGPFDAQKIFDDIPDDALQIKTLKIDWTFYCYRCRGMASMKTCPHGKDDRLLLSGTVLRKTLSEGGDLPEDFSRPEVLAILKDYYAELDDKVEIKLHRAATGKNG